MSAQVAMPKNDEARIKSEKTCEEFITKLKSGMTDLGSLAQQAVIRALDHAYAHGDVNYLKRIHDAVSEHEKGLLRVDPLNAWLLKYAPVLVTTATEVVDGKEKQVKRWKLDKENREAKFKLRDEAEATIWYQTTKEIVVKRLELEDIDTAFFQTIRRFRNAKRFSPTPDALARVNKVENFIKGLQGAKSVEMSNVEALKKAEKAQVA